MKIILLIAITIASVLFSKAASNRPSEVIKSEKLQEYLSSYVSQGTFNGAVLVAHKGEILLSEGFGYANIEWQVPNSPSTKLMIGSITKVFTATTVMKLVEEGKLSLDARLSNLLPWYRKDTGKKISLEQLLNHTSGIPNYLDMRNKTEDDIMKEFGNGPINELEFAKKYCQGDLEFEPGSQWNYNNSVYFLLGLIIEEASGMSYEEALQHYIFQPLQMTNTGDIQASQYKVIPNMASGYLRNFTDYSYPPYWNMSTAFGAGSVYSTLNDLLKFDRALYDPKYLTSTSKVAMFTPKLNHYGCGWEIRESPIGYNGAKRTIRTHEGFLFAWHSRFYQIPEEEYLIVILSNAGNAPLEKMFAGITDILYDRPAENQKPLVAHALWKSLKTNSFNETLNEFKENNPEWDYSERELNRLGYALLPTNQSAAISIFQFIAETYPESWNAWDSYAEGLAASGNKEVAIEAYQKSVKLNPESKSGFDALEKLKKEQ